MRRITLLILITLFSSGLIAQPCLSGWDYRSEIDVDNTSNASVLTNFQVKLTVNTSALVSAGKASADGGDIRFLNSSGTNLEFWIENGTYNTTTTTIWINCDNIAASAITNIYMFYGNSSAILASSGSNTFEMFDDFTGTTLNALNWNNCATNSAIVSSGFVTLTSDGINNSVISSTSTFTAPVVSEMYVNSLSGSSVIMGQADNLTTGYGIKYESTGGGIMKLNLISTGLECVTATDQTLAPNSVSSINTTGIWSFIWGTNASQRLIWPGGDESRTDTDNAASFGQPQTMIVGNIDNSGSTTLDWYRVRKYVANDPVLTLGTEIPLAASIVATSDKSSYCQNDTIFLSVDSVDLATYSWVGPNGFTSNLRTPFIANSSSLNTGNYIVTVSVAGGCSTPNSQVSLDVYSTSVGGTLSGGTTVCEGVNSGNLTLTGSVGDINEWQMSNSLSGPWSTINNVTSTLTYSNLLNTTYFRVLVQNNLCSEDTSNVDSVIVDVASIGGTLIGSNAICVGNNSGNINLYTNTGSVVDWEFSIDNGLNWNTIINSTNTLSYNNLTVPTRYRVEVKNGVCASAYSNEILIDTLPMPVVDFDFDSVCYSNSTVFNNTSAFAGSQINYIWDFGDGSGTIIENPSYTYSTSGSFSVLLTGLTSDGCIDSVRKNVFVKASPNVSFSQTDVCLGNAMSFTNSSSIASGSINTYSWNFGDGSAINNTVSPSYTYGLDNVFTVQLVGESDLGCNDTLVKTVEVYADVTAAFSLSDTVCLGETNNFVSNTVSNSTQITYAWSFGDGSLSSLENPSYTYTSAGKFYVTLVTTTENGCSSSHLDSVLVVSVPVASFSFSNECFGDSTVFTNTTPGLFSYDMDWQFGDGNSSTDLSPKHLYGVAGSYNVSLTATSTVSSQCTSTLIQAVEVYQAVNASFTMLDTIVCLGAVNNVTNTTPTNFQTLSYNWFFGNGASSTVETPSYTYPAIGKYNITLIAANADGCSSSYSDSVSIVDVPSTMYSAANECFGDTMFFLNSTPNKSSFLTTWDFGDGNSSNDFDPKHLYASAGSYNVKLLAVSPFNSVCADSITQTVEVYEDVTARFTMADTSVCLGSMASFSNTSLVNAITALTLSYNWDFGDGNSSSLSSPTYLYTAAGNFNVTLTVTTADGCFSVFSDSIEIVEIPVPGFTAANECFGDSVLFNNLSTGVSPYDISWDFDDSNSSSSTSPKHLYSSYGIYNVKLTVTSQINATCLDSIIQSVEVYPGVVAEFATSDSVFCLANTISFVDSSKSDAATIFYSWTFGDGNSSTLSSPPHLYGSVGIYNVVLQTTTNDGCIDSYSDSMQIVAAPTPSFVSNTACMGDTTFLTNTTLNSNSLDFTWSLGDGTTDTVISPSHVYGLAGTYTVKLVTELQSYLSCSDSVVNTVTVNDSPVADFSLNDACESESVPFTDLSTIGFGTIVDYHWDFGQGDTSIVSAPSNVNYSAGSYNVTLAISSGLGCVDTIVKPLTIYNSPIASFTSVNLCEGNTSTFTNTSSVVSDTIVSFSWDFDDGATSALEFPNHTYLRDTTYQVNLLVQTANSCIHDTTIALTVYDMPVANFSVTEACLGGVTNCTDLSLISNATLLYEWIFDNGDTAVIQSPSVSFATAGMHEINLNVVSNFGCTDSLTRYVEVFNLPNANAGNDSTILKGESLTLNAENSSVIAYAWFPTTALSNNLISTPLASPLVTTEYCVEIKDINGCENSDCILVSVDEVFNVIVSNVITPDGNDENDAWIIQGIEIYDDVQVSIFDLWGKLIYENADYQNNWEGTFNDDQLPDGEYYYVIEEPSTGSVIKGTLTILRNL